MNILYAIINIGGQNTGNNIHVTPALGFLNFGIGVFVSETDPSSDTEVNIVENTVTNALTAIGVQNVLEDAFITDNEVQLYDFNGQTGIYVANGVSSYVWHNAVDANFKNPNPNTGSFTIQTELDETDASFLEIWTISGQRVYSTTLTNGLRTVTLNVAQGLYLYRVTVNGERKWSRKVSVGPHLHY